MSTLSFIMLVGAAMLVTHFRGTNSFPLNRNAAILIDVDDSHETSTTMDLPDSMESTLNKTLEEDDSLEDDRLVKAANVMASANNPAVGAVAAETQQAVPQLNVHERDGFSWDDLVKDLAKVDVPDKSQSTTQVAQVTVDHDDSLEDVLEKLADHLNVEIPTSTEPASIESSTPDDDHSLEDVKMIQQTVVQTSKIGQVPQTTSVRLVFQDDDQIDDFSLEDYAQIINPHAVQLTKMDFHHLPATLFTHPTSDDWFLMRHYMDDDFVWALGDELAKEYFWQPVKSSYNLNAGSPVTVSTDEVAQLTPVRSLWDDRL
uniref:Uncharacterized protein n=1 Tax=Daphnia magna TaxID=35525 RepID=A0A0P6GMX7_9CRUS